MLQHSFRWNLMTVRAQTTITSKHCGLHKHNHREIIIIIFSTPKASKQVTVRHLFRRAGSAIIICCTTSRDAMKRKMLRRPSALIPTNQCSCSHAGNKRQGEKGTTRSAAANARCNTTICVNAWAIPRVQAPNTTCHCATSGVDSAPSSM
ncbi:hypothetical protein TRVL_01616 [Trypanosoma vivax]|nr:hypothetical protein TRVL_01616 [Trypanosoma vivax]